MACDYLRFACWQPMLAIGRKLCNVYDLLVVFAALDVAAIMPSEKFIFID
tara:strand:+ start:214 stop:363 length:150 start_codon:yes stop_codon:yes gene_type:complete